jgi:hypothetical protein
MIDYMAFIKLEIEEAAKLMDKIGFSSDYGILSEPVMITKETVATRLKDIAEELLNA